ncbi:MAG: AAA family ATPase [Proteobacteria bacterium]|nr:AAA family ATPase [Pseudomonadota bacterium]
MGLIDDAILSAIVLTVILTILVAQPWLKGAAAGRRSGKRQLELFLMRIGSSSVTSPDTGLVNSLMNPAAFKHAVSSVELIETHISWVILTDEFVYKIKKPIVLAFLDFRDLERRKFYCEEEIRLNQPWAPDIYLDVVPITLDDGQPRFIGGGTPIEYAVRMRRFDQTSRLDVQLERGQLSVTDMKELGRNIAERHTAAPIVDASQRGRVVRLTKEFIWDNFSALDGAIDEADLNSLREWTERELQGLESFLGQRFDEGYVRDCHGDLHLANLVRLPDGITTFDCIEFNSDLRHIDVACDIAFLVMDLVEKRRHDLAAYFLNRYLESTGDYGSMKLLSLYFVYRCLVRAKVAVILSKERETNDAIEADLAEAHRYCAMAKRQAAIRTSYLVIMSGLSGSGKTRVSGQLMAAMPAIRIRSDLERKRMFGLEETDDSASDLESGIYTSKASRLVYQRLYEFARMILEAGHSVILDAAFLKFADREMAISVATDFGLPCILLQVTAPTEVLRERIRQRSIRRNDASEAGLEVLEHQLATAEPLTHKEETIAISLENNGKIDINALAAQVLRRA